MRLEKSLQMKNNKNLKIEGEESEEDQDISYLDSSHYGAVNNSIEELILSSKV
jgi:hypothetical protein